MKEKEIRPKKLFNKFLYLAAKDIKKYFKGKKSKVKCVACKSDGKFTFNKKNFSYYSCSKCKTLYVNPRPKEKAFVNYYTQSSSIKFLANTLYKKTKEARRKKIWLPKAKEDGASMYQSDEEIISRIWNGGPKGWNKSATKIYWDKVRRELE